MSEKNSNPFEDANVVSVYTSEQAYEDGVFVRLADITPGTWYMTATVFAAIEAKSKASGRPVPQIIVPLLKDVVMLVNATLKENREETLITEGLDGNATGKPLWVGRNENNGWTIMFPEDY